MKPLSRWYLFEDLPLIALGIILFFLLVLNVHTKWTGSIDSTLYDQQLQLLPKQQEPDVIVVEIDEQSLNLIGSWPWDRSLHAQLISELSGAKVIAFNVLLDDNGASEQSDRLLKEAMQNHGQVVLPVYREQSVTDAMQRMVLPDLDFSAVAMLGHVESYPDQDGILRRAHLQSVVDGREWPHFSLLAAQQVMLPSSLPVEDSRGLLVPFSSPVFQTVSYVDVLAQQVPAETFAGKIVFVGMTAAAIGDPLLVSGASNGMQTPAVYINAAVFHAVTREQWINPVPEWSAYGISFLMVLLAVLYVPRLSGLNQIFLTIALLASCLVVSQLLLLRHHSFPISALLGALLFIPFLWNLLRLSRLYRYLNIEVQRLHQQQAEQPFASPVHEEQLPDYDGDIFSRQLAVLQQVRKSSDHAQALFEHSIDSIASGILISDVNGRILFRNRAIDRLFPDNQSTLFELLSVISLQANQEWRDIEKQVLIESEPVVCEGRWQELEFAINIRLLSDPQLDVPLLVVNLTDVSEIKRAQQARLETIDFLSHDLRSPIASIRALVQQARSDGEHLNLDSLLDSVDRYSERSLHFAEQFLQLARVESAVSVDLYEMDMYSICQDAIDTLYYQAKAKSQIINLTCGADSWAWVNGEWMERILVNLISNAIKYSPEHTGIEVNVDVLESVNDEGLIRIAVKDSGTGISPELQSRLFGSFQKGSSKEGIGLGLRFVDVALRRHGSEIQLKSSSAGSTFFFDIKKVDTFHTLD